MANSERRGERALEQPAVKTTIVGGRPPGPGKGVGEIPRGIEILVKKASVDADFKRLLLAKRAEAAREIGLTLEPAEAMMLNAVPAAQLEAIITSTTVAPVSRAAFLGKAAAVMLAALSAAGCDEEAPPVTGSRAEPRPTVGIRSGDLPKTATPPPAPPKPKTETPTTTSPAPPDQPMMPVAGAIAQPVPRTKPNGAPSVAKGVQPDRP
ncbi:MAG TPA: hypothetical protein VNE39_16060 [Planctomycetota bacterium]|nr:hypothetical protein [Planctomycetota bacterium]